MTSGTRLNLIVTDIRSETPSIRSIRLVRSTGEPLPPWEAGAHIKIRLPNEDERCYSLVNISSEASQTTLPSSYLLGVQLEDPTRGGSAYIHSLQVGDAVSISEPVNHFQLERSASPIVLCAGGIGITPILSMAVTLVASGHAHRLVYAGRSRNQLAFLSEIEALGVADLIVHVVELSGILDIKGLMASLQDFEPLYLCGPTAMIAAAIESARELEWAEGRLRFESFASAVPLEGDHAFEVVLKSSARRFLVPVDKTILDVLLEAGEDPLHDCKRGDCSLCQVRVLEGKPDHRDNVLSAAERAEGKVMHICVSRSKTPLLVLDL